MVGLVVMVDLQMKYQLYLVHFDFFFGSILWFLLKMITIIKLKHVMAVAIA